MVKRILSENAGYILPSLEKGASYDSIAEALTKRGIRTTKADIFEWHKMQIDDENKYKKGLLPAFAVCSLHDDILKDVVATHESAVGGAADYGNFLRRISVNGFINGVTPTADKDISALNALADTFNELSKDIDAAYKLRLNQVKQLQMQYLETVRQPSAT